MMDELLGRIFAVVPKRGAVLKIAANFGLNMDQKRNLAKCVTAK
ncbi:hypothetical protein SynBIOSE41_00291 [Synechococcus sp. BIOS-E4-1]|nr:hypothetical protein SynBIOSE41_00291 [Synechococcus sp. BIOS-E4-1]